MVEKYKAIGNSGCTYGIAVDDSYYIQIKLPNGNYGLVQEIDEEGQWGWKWWINTQEIEELDEFPEDCDLTDKL